VVEQRMATADLKAVMAYIKLLVSPGLAVFI
jgi:hypothetical protein